MTTWPGFALRRAANARALLGLLLALVVVSTGVVAGTLGHSRALATRAAASALTDTSVGDVGIDVQTRLGPDPAAQDSLARKLLLDGFSPAPIRIETSHLTPEGEPATEAEAAALDGAFVRWTVRPDLDRIQPEHLEALAGGAERARKMLDPVNVTGRGITVAGDLAATAQRAGQDFAVGEAFRLVPLSVLLLVAIVGLAQVASLLATAREREVGLLLARGASLRQVVTAGLAESLAVALIGAAAGTGMAALAVRAASGTTANGAPVLAGGAVGAGIAVACLGAVAARAARQQARGETVRSDRVRAVAGAAGFVLVAALAALAAWQLTHAGRFLVVDDDGVVRTDVLSALAPALLIAASAVAALILLAPLTRLLELATRRGRSAALWLAGAHLARGLRLHAVPVVLTVLATATATFASLFAGTSAAMQRDLRVLTDGAPLRASVSVIDADYATPLSLPPLSDVDGVTAVAPVWRAEAAQVGDLLLPALVAPTRELAGIAALPRGDAVPDLTVPAPAEGPRPLPIPDGAAELEVTLTGAISLDPWQQLLFERLPETMDDVRYDGIAPGFEDYALAQRVAVTLTLRDATTGQATVLDGPALELPPSVVDGDALRFEGASGKTTGAVALPAGRPFVLDAVTVSLDGSSGVSRTTEVSVDVAVEGASLLGPATAGWGGDAAVSEELAGPYRDQLAATTPKVTVEVEEYESQRWTHLRDNRPPTPSSFLDTASSPWRLTTSGGGDTRIGPAIAFDPALDYDPLEVMKQFEAPAAPPVPVAVTRRVAAEADLGVGDRIEVNAFQARIPAVVSAIVDWVPSVAGGRALLLDSGALAQALVWQDRGLDRPTEVWASVDGDPAAVAEAARAVPGVADVAVASTDQGKGPTAAAADSLWLAAGSALALAVTGLAAAVSTQLGSRRPEVAVLRAIGMAPAAQARSRAWEAGGALGIAAAVGMAAGWAISALVVGPLAWSASAAEVDATLRPDALPLAGILAVGAAAVALIVAWLAATVRRQGLDSEYREEVR